MAAAGGINVSIIMAKILMSAATRKKKKSSESVKNGRHQAINGSYRNGRIASKSS